MCYEKRFKLQLVVKVWSKWEFRIKNGEGVKSKIKKMVESKKIRKIIIITLEIT